MHSKKDSDTTSKKSFKSKVDKAVSPPINYKIIQNVSLQAWHVPTEHGSIQLTPGASVSVPPSVISQRIINLLKRRLISIR